MALPAWHPPWSAVGWHGIHPATGLSFCGSSVLLGSMLLDLPMLASGGVVLIES